MRYMIICIMLMFIFCSISCAGEEAMPPSGLEKDLLGKWICLNAETHTPSTKGLLSIAFLPEKKAEWTICVDGKTEKRTGTYDFELSENLFFPSTTTHIVRLYRNRLPNGAPVLSVLKKAGAPIHLVNVKVGIDNRFSPEVLKFRDAFYSDFVCIREGSDDAILNSAVSDF